jgi:ABC-type phosphate transport system substrate-binding protein
MVPGVGRRAAAVVAMVCVVFGTRAALPASAIVPLPSISGSGSDWAEGVVSQWQADMARLGVTMIYEPIGYFAGLQNYIANRANFAVTEEPFTATQLAALSKAPRGAAFVYVPVAAGGTAAIFNLQSNGTQLTSLRLSARSVCRIFTGRISRWNDPVIAADNPGVALPSLAVTAVVNQLPSPDTWLLSAWCATADHPDWAAFTSKHGLPDAPIGTWPRGIPNQTSQAGSNFIANYVAAPDNVGAIGIVDADAGTELGIPVAALRNHSGTFVMPTGSTVDAALATTPTEPGHPFPAVRSSNPSAYPLSTVTYVVAQTKGFDAAQGASIRDFLDWAIGTGQKEAAALGYAPLPAPFLAAAKSRITQIP